MNVFKRMALIVLAVMLCCIILPMQTGAETTGTCGSDVAWVLDDAGTLTISGTGAMNNYSSSTMAPWYYQATAISSIVIEEGVTSVGCYAFQYCTGLTEVDLPDSVTTIGEYAFYGCTGLTDINFSTGIDRIQPYTFGNCTALTSVEIPGNIKAIYPHVFDGCKNLKNVAFNEGLEVIGYSAFNGTAVEEVVIPKSVWMMSFDYYSNAEETSAYFRSDYSASAFYGSKLKKATFTEGETSIGLYSFYNCTSLSEVVIPDSIATIKSQAFAHCSALTEIALPSSVTSIEGRAFYGCTGLTAVDLPDSVTAIGEYAFYGCTGLTDINFSTGTDRIQPYTFGNCIALTSVEIPGNIKAIYPHVFDGCKNLKNVTFNEGLEVIGYSAFNGTAVEEVVIPKSVWMMSFDYYANEEETSAYFRSDYSASAFYGTKLKKATFTEGATSIGEYSFYNCTSLSEVIIPASVTTIKSQAFAHCSALTEIALPSSVTSIEGRAFYGCTGLTEVDLPDSVTTIGEYAFYGCTGLTDINFSTGIDRIQPYTFGNCTALTSVEIPGNIKAIYPHVFDGCKNLKNVTFNEGLEVIGYSAFNGTAVEEVVIPKSVWMMSFDYYANEEETSAYFRSDYSASAFYGTKLKKVTFTEGETSIGEYSFYNCTSLSEVFIPASVTTIKSQAFAHCSALTEIALPSSVTSIEGRAFYGCTGLTAVDLPDSVTAIGEYAFYGCTGLTDINFSAGIDRIQPYTFGNCTALTSVEIPGNIKAIYPHVFDGCNNLKNVTFNEGLEVIGYSAFNGTAVEEVVIPKSVWLMSFDYYSNAEETSAYYRSDYSASAFYGSKLKKVTFTEGETSIGLYSFYNCTSLSEVIIPDSLTTIRGQAFAHCSALTEITLPSSLTGLGESAFQGCTGLTSVDLPDSVTAMGTYVFYGCAGMTDISISTGIGRIPQYTFGNCTALTSVEIPGNIKAIYPYAFEGCTSLTNVTFNEGLEVIGYSAFSGTAIEEVVIPKSVWLMSFDYYANEEETSAYYRSANDASAFYGSKLKKVTFTEGETSIGIYSFYNCTSLSEVVIPASLNTVKDCAFCACDSLVNVYYCGTQEQWDNIAVGAENSKLQSAVLNFHNFGEYTVITQPTFTTAGQQQKNCLVCGYAVTETVDMLVGEVLEWNVALEDDFEVNFLLNISESIESAAEIKVTAAGAAVTYHASELEKENGCYTITARVCAAQMNDTISVQVINGKDCGEVFAYTVRQYCDTILNDEDHSHYHALVKEMLNYGAAAQVYFDYNAENLANNGITDVGTAQIPDHVDEEFTVTGSAEGVSFYAASLLHRDKIALRYYFRFTGDINSCTFTANGVTYAPQLKDGLYYVDVADILPENLDQQFQLTVTDGSGGTLTVSYSPMNYIVRMGEKGSDRLKALLTALYNYHLAAKEVRTAV